jgi:uncharacterized protein YukE
MLGADIEALRQFAAGMRRRSDEISALTEELARMVADLPWVGDDRENFLADWSDTHQPSLVALCSDLTDAAVRAFTHADEQEAASRINGGGGW